MITRVALLFTALLASPLLGMGEPIDMATSPNLLNRNSSLKAQYDPKQGPCQSPLDCAYQISIQIPDPQKAPYLSLLARSVMESGDTVSAFELAQQVKQVAGHMRYLRLIADLFIQKAEQDSLESVLSDIEYTQTRQEQTYLYEQLALFYIDQGKVLEAQSIIQKIRHGIQKSRMMRSLSERLLDQGQYQKAISLSESIRVTNERDLALSMIATALIDANLTQKGIQLSQRIRGEETRDQALSQMAQILAQKTQFNHAYPLMNQIKSPSIKAQTQLSFVTVYAQESQFEVAMQITEQISDPDQQNQALLVIVESLANQGHFVSALDLADAISVPYYPAAITAIAVAYGHGNDPEQAFKLLTQLEDDDMTAGLLAMSSALASSPEYLGSLFWINKITPARLKDQALSAYTRQFMAHQKLEKTQQLLDKIKDPSIYEQCSLTVIAYYASERFYEAALALATENRSQAILVPALGSLLSDFSVQVPNAKEILTHIGQLMQGLDQTQVLDLWLPLARYHAELGDTKVYQGILNTFQFQLQQMPESRDLDEQYIALLAEYVQMNDMDTAIHLLAMIQDPKQRFEQLLALQAQLSSPSDEQQQRLGGLLGGTW